MINGILGARRRERGFTLIELLVVVVILGIVSGIAVFAVRGTGDKGEQSARAADRRIVRTAMETFCARYGRYAEDMDELVKGPRDGAGGRQGKGFLSNDSTYNATIVSVPAGETNCGGTGYEFSGEAAKCLRLDDQGEEETVNAESDMWCMAAAPTGGADNWASRMNLAQLKTGQVLVVHGDRITGLPPKVIRGTETTLGYSTELFDPSDGPRGSWSPAAPVYHLPTVYDGSNTTGLHPQKVLAINGRAGHLAEDCGQNCGKALAYVDHWSVYDPATDTWDEVDSAYTPIRSQAQAVQLLGPGCDPHCGKFVIVGAAGSLSKAELYDPVTHTIEFLLTWGNINSSYHDFELAELDNGQVLLVTKSGCKQCGTPAFLLDPENRVARPLVATGRPPDNMLIYQDALPTALPGGRGILFVSSYRGYIYHPDDTGTGLGEGSWEQISGCWTQPSHMCRIMAQLPDGRVLVNRAYDFYWGSSAETVIYDSAEPDPAKRWNDADSLNHQLSAGFSVVLSRGPCGVNCNRVLTVSERQRAELYKP